MANLSLSPVEETRLTVLETVIDQGRQTFIEVGNALLEIRDSRLYRQTHGTFEAYCTSRWDFTYQRAYQLIEAARVSTMVEIAPANERQARELAPLLGDAVRLREAWAEANENGDATAAKVRESVAKRLPGPREAQRIAIAENRVVVGTDGYYTPTSHIDADTRWQIIREWAQAIERELPDDPADIPIPEYATGLEESAERVREYVTRFLMIRRHEEAA